MKVFMLPFSFKTNITKTKQEFGIITFLSSEKYQEKKKTKTEGK